MTEIKDLNGEWEKISEIKPDKMFTVRTKVSNNQMRKRTINIKVRVPSDSTIMSVPDSAVIYVIDGKYKKHHQVLSNNIFSDNGVNIETDNSEFYIEYKLRFQDITRFTSAFRIYNVVTIQDREYSSFATIINTN